MNNGKVILCVMAGAAAGAILGILFAPEKGSVTRKKITDKGEEYADAVKDKFDEVLDSISEKYENVKEEIYAFADQGKAKFENTKNTGNKTV